MEGVPPTFGENGEGHDAMQDVANAEGGDGPPDAQRRRLHLEAPSSIFPASAPASSHPSCPPGLQRRQTQAQDELNTAGPHQLQIQAFQQQAQQAQQHQQQQQYGPAQGSLTGRMYGQGAQQQQQQLSGSPYLPQQQQQQQQQQQHGSGSASAAAAGQDRQDRQDAEVRARQSQQQQQQQQLPPLPMAVPEVNDLQSLAAAFTQGLSMLSDKLDRFTNIFEKEMREQQVGNQRQLQAMQNRIQELEQGQEERIRKIMQEMATEHQRPGYTPPASRPSTPRRQQEDDEVSKSLVIGTFARNTHKNVIEAALQPALAKAQEVDNGAKVYCEYLKSSVGFIGFTTSEQASAAYRLLSETKWTFETRELWVGFKKTRAQRARSTAIRRAMAGAKLWSPSVEICYRSGRVWDGDWMVGFWDKEVQRFRFSTDWLEFYHVSSEDVLEAAAASNDWG